MKSVQHVRPVAKHLLEIDNKVRKTAMRHREEAGVKALSWLGEFGDQPQMRLLAGAMMVAGLMRSNARMVRAGTRMLAAHEVATSLKNLAKHRVDRSRPRSASGKDGHKPHRGRSEAKEKTSFPSGHSAGPMAAARAFAAEYPEHREAAHAAAGAVALAQIPKCAHYPTDVGAGLAIGLASEALVGLAWSIAAAALEGTRPDENGGSDSEASA